MEKKIERRGLGRGLSALMSDIQPVDTAETGQNSGRGGEVRVGVDQLKANPDQPRRFFAKEALEDLAASIRQKGVLQPLIVRPTATEGEYEIVAGERRWRAAQIANVHDLPVLIRNFSDNEVLEVAIIENIQRSDLNAIEEAAGFRQLMERFGHTQEKLAEALSKSRSHIANLLRLLQLPEDVQDLVKSGDLSSGHARALISTPNPSQLAREVVAKGLSVRETEALAKASKPDADNRKSTTAPKSRRFEKDADTLALEADLSANLKMSVSINHEPGGDSGILSIRYNTLDDLDNLCRALSGLEAE